MIKEDKTTKLIIRYEEESNEQPRDNHSGYEFLSFYPSFKTGDTFVFIRRYGPPYVSYVRIVEVSKLDGSLYKHRVDRKLPDEFNKTSYVIRKSGLYIIDLT